jgi:hypothetical protein
MKSATILIVEIVYPWIPILKQETYPNLVHLQ